MSSEMMTKYAAAKRLGVAPATVLRMVERGELSEPERGSDGTYMFPADEVDALAERRSGEEPEPVPVSAERYATETLGEARLLMQSAHETLKWLVMKQQDVIGTLSEQLKNGLQGWAEATNREAAQRLEAETVLGAERRKDKAVDAVLEAAPRILEQSIKARAGSKLVARLVALEDGHWEVLRSGASDLLGVSKEELEELEKLRAAAKAAANQNQNPNQETK